MQLLLEAALLEKTKALNSWQAYLEKTDLQNIDRSATTLLPLVYRNLKENSHPLCKSVYRHTWVSNQTLWAKTLPTLNKFLDAGIEKIALLKGMALIIDHYLDFGLRVIGDIDVLIDRTHLRLAHSLLLTNGWICTLKRFDPNNEHQLSRWHAVNYTHTSGMNLDVHWSLLLESHPNLDREALQAIPPGIHPATPTHLLFQTCIHGNKKSKAPLIRWIPDSLTLLKSSIDFSELERIAKESHLTISLSSALSCLSERFQAPVPSFTAQPTVLETREFQANQRGQIYLAGYFRARIRKQSLLHYLQFTANLKSAWHIPLYAPYWMLKRIYRLIKKIFFNS